MNSRFRNEWLCLIIYLLILRSFSLGSGHVTLEDISLDIQTQRIFTCSDANQLVLSNQYLYLRNGSKNIIRFEQDVNTSFFQSTFPIGAFTAINKTLVLSPGNPLVLYAINHENQTHSVITSNISLQSTGGIGFIGVYDHYIYTANYEWGFPIFDYSNVTNPGQVGAVPVNTWHSRQLYFTSHFGFFNGDHRGEIFDFSSNPRSPSLVLTTFDYWASSSPRVRLDIKGKPAVSHEFFVINHLETTADENRDPYVITRNILTIIPRLNAFSGVFNVSYSSSYGYRHCFLLNEDILGVTGVNNTLSFFHITSRQELTPITTIVLDSVGSIEDICYIEGTRELYVADGVNGLLKFSFDVERTSLPDPTSELIYLDFSVCMIIFFVFYLFKKRKK